MDDLNCLNLIVEDEETGTRLDKWLMEQFDGVSRSQVQKWIIEGLVRLDGVLPDKNDRLKGGDVVSVVIEEKPAKEIIPQNIPLDILYEDEYLLVVNKPKNMVVHPAAGNPDGTLVNALLFHCNGKLAKSNGEIRQGIVHRIDKDTSGLLVVAKEESAYDGLAAQVKEHTMDRFYEAVVYGKLRQNEGTIALPIGRSPKDRKKMAVTYQNSKEAITHYKVLKQYEQFAQIQCKLETGRTHQIRVHMATLGHPLAGDPTYGPKKVITCLNGQCLHARSLGFIHPVTGEKLYFEAPLPEYFLKFLSSLK